MAERLSLTKGEDFSYPRGSVFGALEETVKKHADRPVMYFYGTETSYAQFFEQVEKLSAFLQAKGIGKGDGVAIMLPNCPQYVVAFYAAMRLGAVVVQVNPMYVAREVEYTVTDSGAKALVVLDRLMDVVKDLECVQQLNTVIAASFAPTQGAEVSGANVVTFAEALAQELPIPAVAEIDPLEDVAVLQYTGGTTGRSKGAMLTHDNLVANAWMSTALVGGGVISERDKVLTAVPLFHIYGLTTAMNVSVFNGSAMVLLPRFEVQEVLETFKRYQPEYFPGVPTMYVAIANHPNAKEYDIDCIRLCYSGSAPLPVEVIHTFEAKTGAKILEGYGLSEASPATHFNRVDMVRKPGSIGPVFPGTEAGIVDLATGEHFVPAGELGELVIRGPQVFKGYWNMPEETAVTLKDGWLHTGDIARMDEDGYYYIVDRKKDMIISSGYNIYPRDVEEVLYEHPNVQEAVVVGVPDEYRGETVKAFVVLKEEQDAAVMEQELDGWCRSKLAPYKVPRIYEFRTELPKTAVGKILRRALRG